MANYRDMKDLVEQALQSTKVKSLIPEFISQGQKLLERKLRIRAMEKLTISGTPLSQGVNIFALPSDYIEAIYFALVDGKTRYTIYDRRSQSLMVESDMAPLSDTTNTGVPSAITRVSNSFYFNRYLDKAYNYEFSYFARLTTLANDADTNWWTEEASDTLLYASLVSASPLLPTVETSKGLMVDPRTGTWEARFLHYLGELIRNDNRERLSGSRKRVRYQD